MQSPSTILPLSLNSRHFSQQISEPRACRLANTTNQCEPILCVGPSLVRVGGMAEVVRQMVGLNLGPRYRVVPFAITCSTSNREWRVCKVIRHLEQSVRLIRAIQREGVRLVHVHTCSGATFYRSAADLLAARQCGCRTILHVHGGAFDRFYAKSSRLARGFIRRVLSAADIAVALSPGWKRTLLSIEPRAKLVVMENAVRIPPETPVRRVGDNCRLLFMGRMDREKGLEELLNAAAVCREAGTAITLTLAGGAGTMGGTDTIRREIAARGLADCVQTVGELEGARKEFAYAEADALVLPSHFEGMPIAVLEAMARGLPVIATTVGAIPEVITDQQEGLLVPPVRSDLLAQAIMRLASDSSLRAAMGARARQTAESRFSLDRFEAKIVDLYDRIMHRGPQWSAPSHGAKREITQSGAAIPAWSCGMDRG